MSNNALCPAPELLSKVLLGNLPDAEVEAIEQHLLTCEKCLAATRELKTSDTFIAALREQPRAQGELAGQRVLVAQVKERLRQQGFGESGSQPTVILASGSIGTSALEGMPIGSPGEALNIASLLRPAEAADELGRLGPFRVLKLLGMGGMGAVFEAEDVQLKRRVALKVIRPDMGAHSQAGPRFLREAQAAASLHHDHIVTIYQVGQDGQIPFMAMELLAGESLDDRLEREKTLAPADVVRIARETAEGLAAAHERGLLHRDIKPANIWLEKVRGRERVKLLDFGLARTTDGDAKMTREGHVVGTLEYMAPEQAAGEELDQRADLFSLGCVLYRLSTGLAPFRGPNTIAILTALSLQTPSQPVSLNPAVPPDLSALIMRLLAKDRADRPASAAALVEELGRIDLTPLVKSPPTVEVAATRLAVPVPKAQSASPPKKRLPLIAVAAAAAAVVILCGIIVIIRDRFGKEVGRMEVPDGGSLTVGPSDKPQVPEKPVVPEKPPNEPVVPTHEPRWVPGPSMGVLPGLAPRPAAFTGIERWQVETIAPRMAAAGGARIWSLDGRFLMYRQDGLPAVTRLYELNGGALALRQIISHGDSEHRSNDRSFSPEGRRVALVGRLPGSAKKCVQIWDLAAQSALVIGTLSTTADAAVVAWSPNGKWLAVSSYHNSTDDVEIWDAETHQLIAKLQGERPARWAYSLAWSNDSRQLAAASFLDKTVCVWNAESWKVVRTMELPFPPVALHWRADGKELQISAEAQGLEKNAEVVRFWNVESDEVRLKLPLSPATPPVTGYSPDGKWFAASEGGGWRRLHRVADGQPEGPKIGGFGVISTWHPDGKLTSVEASTGLARVALYDLEAKSFSTLLEQPPTVRGVVWSPSGETVATFGNDKLIRLWRASDGKPGPVLRGHAEEVLALSFNSDGTQLASAGSDKRALLWNLAGTAPPTEFALHGAAINAVVFSADDRYLATASNDKTVRIWDCQTREFKYELVGHDKPVRGLAWNSDHRRLASIGDDNSIRIWDATTGKPELKIEEAGSKAVVWSPDGKRLIGRKIWSDDGTLADKQLSNPKDQLPRGFTWTRDASRLAVTFEASQFAQVQIYNAPAWSPAKEFRIGGQHIPALQPVSWSPDGKQMAVANAYSNVEVRDPISGEVKWRAVPLPDGRAATISAAGEVNLSDPAAEKELVYYVQNLDDSFETLSPAEFRQRVAGATASKGVEKEGK